MTKRKIILIAALCGAAVGLFMVRVRFIGFKTDHALAARPEFLLAIAGWLLFTLYWEYAARDATKARSSESRLSRGVHVVLTNAALLLVIAPVASFGRFIPMATPIMAIGLAIEAAGLFLSIWARRHLGRHWSGEITIKVDHELIRSGPYKLLRHPIYTGILTMYAGTALVIGTRLALIGVALGALAYWRKIRLEEANLSAAFGPDYAAYRRETWALVPGVF